MTNNEIIKKITIALSLHHDVVRELSGPPDRPGDL